MAVTHSEEQVVWSAANSVSISAGGTQTSDDFTFNANSYGGKVQCKADNDGTPASGDTVDFYLSLSLGDPDGASTEEYPGINQAIHLGTIDTNTVDGDSCTVEVPVGLKGKIIAKNNSAGRAITVSACVYQDIVS